MFVVDQNFQKHCQAGQHLKPWSNHEEISVNSLEPTFVITIHQKLTWCKQLIFDQKLTWCKHLILAQSCSSNTSIDGDSSLQSKEQNEKKNY